MAESYIIHNNVVFVELLLFVCEHHHFWRADLKNSFISATADGFRFCVAGNVTFISDL